MELFAADGHDAGGCERVTGKSGMRPRGPATLLYGSSVVGGLINTITPQCLRKLPHNSRFGFLCNCSVRLFRSQFLCKFLTVFK